MIHFQKQPVRVHPSSSDFLKTLINFTYNPNREVSYQKRELTGIMQITRKLQLILTEHPLCVLATVISTGQNDIDPALLKHTAHGVTNIHRNI